MLKNELSGSVESRVAAIEAQIVTLAGNIERVLNVVQQQGQQIGSLAVGLSAAQGPRKFEWGTMISAVGLFMAIGAAALSPLYLRSNDFQNTLLKLDSAIESHEKIVMHPVAIERLRGMDRETELLRQSTTEKSAAVQAQLEMLRDKVFRHYPSGLSR